MNATGWSRGLEVTGGGTGVVSHAGPLPPVRIADRVLEGVACIRLDATVVQADGDKKLAEANFEGYGHHPLLAACDNTGEPLAWMLRPGSAGPDTAADHRRLLREAIEALPPALRRTIMVTCDAAGASHELVKELARLASRHGYQVTWSVGRALSAREQAAIGKVAETGREAAIDGKGQVRERRAEDACQDQHCAHPACWVEEAHVTELTGLLREGQGGDQLKAWPKGMRVFARRERPHPGARLSLIETAGGWRYSLWATNLRADTRGWRGQCACAGAAHRVRARIEDVIRTGKDAGLGHFPSHDYGLNASWPDAAMTACILLSWLKLTALDGDLARAEPKTLRYRLPYAAARLVRGGRRRTLKISANWPWPDEIITAWQRIHTIPHPT